MYYTYIKPITKMLRDTLISSESFLCCTGKSIASFVNSKGSKIGVLLKKGKGIDGPGTVVGPRLMTGESPKY